MIATAQPCVEVWKHAEETRSMGGDASHISLQGGATAMWCHDRSSCNSPFKCGVVGAIKGARRVAGDIMHTSTQWATHLQFTPIVATNSLLLALLAQFEVSTTLAILAGAMDGQGILAKYRDFCVPHKVLTRVEAEEASKLVEVAKAFLWGKAKAL
eukprot:7212804-Lingulodinium_polyedra.AAC.1